MTDFEKGFFIIPLQNFKDRTKPLDRQITILHRTLLRLTFHHRLYRLITRLQLNHYQLLNAHLISKIFSIPNE